MITFISLIVFSAFYTLYHTSAKVHLSNHFQLERWIHENINPARLIGISLLCIAYLTLFMIKDAVATTLLFLIQVMTIGGLVVILTPLKIITYRFLLITIVVAFFFEINT